MIIDGVHSAGLEKFLHKPYRNIVTIEIRDPDIYNALTEFFRDHDYEWDKSVEQGWAYWNRVTRFHIKTRPHYQWFEQTFYFDDDRVACEFVLRFK